MDEDVQFEVEALQATYDELLLDEKGPNVGLRVLPVATSDNDQQYQAHFVEALLQLSILDGYPEAAAPGIHLADVRGLGSERLALLVEALRAEAANLLGEMMLGHLFETARAFLTEHNWPEGACIFCLEDLVEDSGCSSSSGGGGAGDSGNYCSRGDAAAATCMRLPCFHAFHQECFGNWWCWQQHAFKQQEQQLHQQTGATAATALAQEQLPAKDSEGLFLLSCPTCRAAFSLQHDLQIQLQDQLRQQYQQQQQQQQQRAGGSGNSQQSNGRLSAAQLAPFREIQQQHAALFAAQQARQGIIMEVNYSITDWDASSSSAAAAGTSSAAAAAASSASATGSNVRAANYRGGRAPHQQNFRLSTPPAAVSGAPGRGGTREDKGRAAAAGRRGARHRGNSSVHSAHMATAGAAAVAGALPYSKTVQPHTVPYVASVLSVSAGSSTHSSTSRNGDGGGISCGRGGKGRRHV